MEKKAHLPDSAKWFSALTTYLPMVFYILDQDGMFLMSEGRGLKKLGLAWTGGWSFRARSVS